MYTQTHNTHRLSHDRLAKFHGFILSEKSFMNTKNYISF